MSASRAIKKGVYDKKILTNISISTKQLETIYHSLTYLNFSDKKEPRELVDMELIVQRVVAYYKEFSSAKKIEIVCQTQHKSIQIIPSRAELLL
jgi:two-component system OmpR family sensor kinase